MFCSNCGNKIENSNFCSKCGNRVNNIPIKKEKKKKNNKLFIILILLIVLTIVLGVCAVIVSKNDNKVADSRTIMIYMAGSNLESDAKIATSDLDSIIPDQIDLNKTNILLYTGSTRKWHNFASADENAIYILKEDGFKKLESFKEKSLGDSDVFKSFLNYAYTNYKTDKYDLIFWNHGLGALGSISDEESNDFLTLVEMNEALKNSYFSENNKLDTVLFRTCLNATYEMASVFSKYSKYMIASEEITIGKTGESVLNFINDINPADNGIEYGKKFITAYQNQVDNIDIYSSTDSTYSIIDLTKFEELDKKIDDFFDEINVKNNYNKIAKIRSNMHQYAVSTARAEDYDTIDLYELINELKSYSKEEAKKIMDLIDEMVVYNWATNNSSHGLAIYFPFNGVDKAKEVHLGLYNKIDVSDNYYKFIKDFNNYQNDEPTFSFSLKTNEIKMQNKEFSLKLNEEQLKNYASSSYIIFRKTEDNLYVPIYSSNNTKIDDNAVISTNVSNNLIKVVDKSDNSEVYIQAYETSNKDKEYITSAVLYKLEEDYKFTLKASNMYLKIDKEGKPVVTKTTLIDNDSKASSAAVNYKDYTTVQFGNFRYNILDANGNYNENWEGSSTKHLYEVKTENIEFKTASLDDEGEYYCVFKIKDVKNNYYYSNLIKVN